MAFSYSPKIVTDGLVLYLDAANTKSYVSGSTVWNDISNFNNNTTLVPNGASNISFNTSSLGSISFTNNAWGRINNVNDINGFTRGPHWDLNWTLDFWVNSPLTRIGAVLGARTAVSGQQGLQIFVTSVNNGWTYCKVNRDVDLFSTLNQPSILNSVNRWMHFAVTSEDAVTYRIYVNGVQIHVNSINWRDNALRVNVSSTNPYLISTDNTNWQTGDYSCYKLYNRTLTANEVRRNFEATRGRYGL
jgi:hypothetical protein